ncbi:MAG: TolC family protein [Bacteroidaceae bacterium]|nr:TolC family protein [Bacteroidaceae bacterium]
MKKRLSLSIATLMVLTTVMTTSAQTATNADSVLYLDMDKALTIALSESPTIKVADIEVKKKDYSKRETIAGLLPKIDASASYQRSIKKQRMYMSGKAFDIGAMMGEYLGPLYEAMGIPFPGSGGSGETEDTSNDGFEVGLDNTYSMGFSASLPIIAPQLWKSVEITSIDVQNAMEAARSSRLSLINEVQKAYYNVLLCQDSYAVLRSQYDNAKLNAETYASQYEQGTASEYDVLRSEVAVRNIEPTLLQTENAVKLSKLQLKVLMGIDVDIDIVINDKLDNYEQDMYHVTMSIDRSLDNNTDLRQLDLQTKMLEKTATLQKFAYIPTLAAQFNYNWISMSDGGMFDNFRFNPYSTVAVALNIPIFSGGSRFYKVKQAEATVAQMGFQRDNLERALNMQVEAQLDAITKSIKQIDSNKLGVQQAEKAYNIMQKSFEIGSATFVTLNDAELALTRARLAYSQAIYDFLAGVSDVKKLLGTTDISKYEPQENNK